MIAKNEEAFLDASLKSVKSVLGFDDIIVVDTGSEDRTKDIALENGAEVFDFVWCEDFSAARNFATEKARNDWILALDADEIITSFNGNELKSFIKDKHYSIGAIKIISPPEKNATNISRFYNKKYYQWDGNIHEQLVPVSTHEKNIVPLHIIADHYGYTPEVKESKGKFERNLRMLEAALAKDSNDPYILAQLGKCYYVNGGDLLRACEYFEKALSKDENPRLEYVYITVEYYGYSLLNTGQYEKALELVIKYSEYYNNKVDYRFLSAHVFQNNGLFQEAVEYYESCIGVDTFDPQGMTSFLSYYNIGVILECVGMIEDAIAVYKSCGDYEPALARLAEIDT